MQGTCGGGCGKPCGKTDGVASERQRDAVALSRVDHRDVERGCIEHDCTPVDDRCPDSFHKRVLLGIRQRPHGRLGGNAGVAVVQTSKGSRISAGKKKSSGRK